MTLDTLRTFCLEKKSVTETFPFDEDTLVFKVLNKAFALISIENPDTVNLKCDPERAVELREQYEEIVPGYHMNKKHWNTVSLIGRLDDTMVKELVNHSYELVVRSMSKKDQSLILNGK